MGKNSAAPPLFSISQIPRTDRDRLGLTSSSVVDESRPCHRPSFVDPSLPYLSRPRTPTCPPTMGTRFFLSLYISEIRWILQVSTDHAGYSTYTHTSSMYLYLFFPLFALRPMRKKGRGRPIWYDTTRICERRVVDTIRYDTMLPHIPMRAIIAPTLTLDVQYSSSKILPVPRPVPCLPDSELPLSPNCKTLHSHSFTSLTPFTMFYYYCVARSERSHQALNMVL